MNKDISKESAQQIAVEFMKQRKNTPKIDVAVIEQDHADWVVRGTCPINMEGHPWAEKFEVVVDTKGKIKRTHSSLL
jgi:hypothetical protein